MHIDLLDCRSRPEQDVKLLFFYYIRTNKWKWAAMAPEFFFYYAVDSESGFSAWYADTCPDVTCLSAVPSVLYAVCT